MADEFVSAPRLQFIIEIYEMIGNAVAEKWLEMDLLPNCSSKIEMNLNIFHA